MSIIIISADARESEEAIAGKVADAAGYQVLDRSVLASIAEANDVDADRLTEALDNRPTLLKKIAAKQWRFFLAIIEAGVCEKLLEDKLVCLGLGAHLYARDVSHALKVRLLSAEKARDGRYIEHRRKWSLDAYGYDETDPAYYDLVINLDNIDPDEAVKTITDAAAYRKFQPMTYSIKCLSDQALAARVSVALLKSISPVQVESRDGSVVITTRASMRDKHKKVATIKELAGAIDGVNYVEVHFKSNMN